MSYVLIGDVHGCLEELEGLIEDLDLDDDDVLIFLGDLIDYGPNSLGVLRYVQELSSNRPVTKTVALRGNHEQSLLLYAKAVEKGTTKEKTQKDILLSQFTESDTTFLRNTKLFYMGENFIAVHAGIPPRVVTDPRNFDTMSPSERRRISQCTYIENFNPATGFTVQYTKRREFGVFWAPGYDGRFGHCYFGHRPDRSIRFYKNATCIDTGCVLGGRLTAAILGTDSDSVAFMSRKSYMRLPAKRVILPELMLGAALA